MEADHSTIGRYAEWMRRRKRALTVIGLLALGLTTARCGGGTEFTQQRPPILETVVSGNRVIPQDPDGAFAAIPAPSGKVRVRVQADWGSNIAVSVDGVDLPRREGRPDSEAWFEPSSRAVRSASRTLFWDIAINLPADKRGSPLVPTPAAVRIEVRDQTYLQNPPPLAKRPPLAVELIHVAKPGRTALASDFYNEAEGDNTKEDGRAKSQVIAKGVVLAGWLFEGDPATPYRNDGSEGQQIRANESEDYHYDFWLDNEFVSRNYGTPINLEPVRSAVVKGARSRLVDLRPGWEFPLLNDGRINAASFTWPGSALFTAELNAWHIADRGVPPAGWAGREPTEPDKDGNAWPFRPRRPLGVDPDDPELATGEYVIVSGTLWQDTMHAGDDEIGRFRRCWDDHFPGHGGWLELHPVDSVRRVDPPHPRIHAELVSVCDPARRDITTVLTPRLNKGETANPDSILRCERIVDRRFTRHNRFSHAETLTNDSPPKLRVTLITLIGTTAQIDYLLWYEKPDGSRPDPDPAQPCTDWTGD
jgi:hypothetical protein